MRVSASQTAMFDGQPLKQRRHHSPQALHPVKTRWHARHPKNAVAIAPSAQSLGHQPTQESLDEPAALSGSPVGGEQCVSHFLTECAPVPAMAADLEARWPGWPEGVEGSVLLDVVIDLQVDAAFLLFFGGQNELRVSDWTHGRPRRPAQGTTPAADRAGRAVPAAAPAAAAAGKPPSSSVFGMQCPFRCLASPAPPPQKTYNESAGNKDFSTTPWLDTAEAVEAAAVGPTPPPLASVAGLKAGMLRRASYSGYMLGSKVGAAVMLPAVALLPCRTCPSAWLLSDGYCAAC